jgi:hypothetical protein
MITKLEFKQKIIEAWSIASDLYFKLHNYNLNFSSDIARIWENPRTAQLLQTRRSIKDDNIDEMIGRFYQIRDDICMDLLNGFKSRFVSRKNDYVTIPEIRDFFDKCNIPGYQQSFDRFIYDHLTMINRPQKEIRSIIKKQKALQLAKLRLIENTSKLLQETGQWDTPVRVDEDMRRLGSGLSIMRNRFQTGKTMPAIQYAPKLPTQTPKQQVARQTLKHVTSEMKDDTYKLLLELMK